MTIPQAWRLIDDVELVDQPDPEYLIEGMLGRGSISVLYGPPGTGKTTMAAATAVAVATGRPFFGHAIRHRGSVIYIGPDDPGGWKPRLLAAKRDAGISLDTTIGVYLFPEPFDLLDTERVTALLTFLQSVEWPAAVELVIIDTYAAVVPGANENAVEDTTRAMVALQRIRAGVRATVLLIHHTNAGGSRERGHSAMRGAADTMLALNLSDDLIKFECSKQRNGAAFKPFTLKLVEGTNGGCVFRLAADMPATEQLTPNQQKALDVLRDNFSSDGAHKSEWQRACSDMQERTFHRSCKRLIELGLVRPSGPRFVIATDITGTTDKSVTRQHTDNLSLSIGCVSPVTCQ